jgi:hypothetical protein
MVLSGDEVVLAIAAAAAASVSMVKDCASVRSIVMRLA